jgi:hypothetical protein
MKFGRREPLIHPSGWKRLARWAVKPINFGQFNVLEQRRETL